MQFEPLGGFPPIVRVEDIKPKEKALESRGFATTNIVNIGNIMDTEKKENLFIAFGTEDEDGVDLFIENMFDQKPHVYKDIVYEDVPKGLSKIIGKKSK